MTIGIKFAIIIKASALTMYPSDLFIKTPIIKYMFYAQGKHILDNRIKKLKLPFRQKCRNLTFSK